MKFAKILIVAFGLMMIATGVSFAQQAAAFISSASPNVLAVNAQTGLVGDIALTQIGTPGAIPNGEIVTFSYEAPISTLSELHVFVNGVEFTNFPNTFPSAVTIGNVVVTVQNATQITISFNASITPTVAPFIMIQDVRVDATKGPSEIHADITTILSSITVTNPHLLVGTTREPISLTGPTGVSSSINTIGEGTASATVTVTELFENAFETEGATNPTQVVLKLNLPPNLVVSSATTSDSFTLLTLGTPTVNTAGNQVTIPINQQDPNVKEAFSVTFTFVGVNPPVPVNPGSITVTATLAPPAPTVTPFAVGVNGVVTPYRFADHPTAPVTISFTVGSLVTNLLSTYNVYVQENEDLGIVGFNTGFAIGNAGDILDLGGQPGTITVTLYPRDGGAAVSFTTSATKRPGVGLDANGNLPVGATWTVLLATGSNDIKGLVETAGLTGNFTGMIVFHTNFSGAEGVNFIADPTFSVQSQGYQMLDVSWEQFVKSGEFFRNFD